MNRLIMASKGFGEVLVVGVCLLSVVRIPLVTSAPAGMDRMNSKPKWINPCGVDTVDAELDPDFVKLSDAEVITQILVQAKNAQNHAVRFRDEYVQKTFNLGLREHHDAWKTHRYEWLPSEYDIPKGFGEPTPAAHLETLELESSIKNIYQYMQRYAVGLEQVTWDQDDNNGPFEGQFVAMENLHRALLCELQVGIIEHNLPPPVDVGRDIMDPNTRNLKDTTYRNIRDWLIFRDYMNALEYTVDVFEHFLHKVAS